MTRRSDDLTFLHITMSKAALRQAIADGQPQAEPVEQLGAALARKLTPLDAYDFSQEVCAWTRTTGKRVLGNLNKHHTPHDLGRQLCDWFAGVLTSRTDVVTTAISCGCAIKGLDVSFASKHLRMLRPKRFAVLDSVLSRELGFALNPAGYAFFLRELRAFRQDAQLRRYSLGDLEMGLYLLIKDGDFVNTLK